MKKSAWKTYTFWIIFTVAVGALSGFLTQNEVQIFNESIIQPPLSPPAFLFPLVWTLLYVLMGISAARISLQPPSAEQEKGLKLFLVQLLVNFLWSPIFFNAQAFGIAFLWLLLLWVLVRRMIISFHKIDPVAAYLQLPYLLWLTFAAYLHLGVWYLNR